MLIDDQFPIDFVKYRHRNWSTTTAVVSSWTVFDSVNFFSKIRHVRYARKNGFVRWPPFVYV